jgi:hypothetical protein
VTVAAALPLPPPRVPPFRPPLIVTHGQLFKITMIVYRICLVDISVNSRDASKRTDNNDSSDKCNSREARRAQRTVGTPSIVRTP